MIISGMLSGPGDTASATSPPVTPPPLIEGKILVGRVSQAGPDGQGIVRFPNGSGFSFSGGQGLRVGEQVTLEVTRLVPEVTVRLVGSESGAAAQLAQSATNTLIRAPDLLGSLLKQAGGRGAALVAGRDALSGVLQKALPNVSFEGLLKGDVSALVRLLETGTRQEVLEAVHGLRRAADSLRFDAPVTGREDAAELTGARVNLQRLGDLLTLQHVLPQVTPQEDGGALLGYRLFWMHEGGLGEAIWREEREKRRQERKSGRERMVSVLLSLNMTRLGLVQARLSHGDGLLRVGLAARDDAALVALRGGVGALRQHLLAAGLPLHTLDLSKLGEGEMQAERMRALGLESGFATEV
ncbi:MAG: flagellar hook-length control protein FliK [Magnetococcales bacterium]|nr:flagellar hook-length control protein FliK [Magnetococcales bacterium]